MKRILYLSLLLIIPFLLQAGNGRNRLNGKWISPYFDTQIKIKVKRHEIRVKGLTRRGWTSFIPIRRNVFEDCSGNRIKFKSVHNLIYINRYRGERIRFIKKGHRHHNHVCNSSCHIGNDFFDHGGQGYSNYYENDYYEDYYNDWGQGDDPWRNRDRRGNGNNDFGLDNRFDGRYHVREIDEYVTINRTRRGLKAKRGNGSWVNYTQNRLRKNEYIDKKGNRYLVRNDGSLTWKNKKGDVSLNLNK